MPLQETKSSGSILIFNPRFHWYSRYCFWIFFLQIYCAVRRRARTKEKQPKKLTKVKTVASDLTEHVPFRQSKNFMQFRNVKRGIIRFYCWKLISRGRALNYGQTTPCSHEKQGVGRHRLIYSIYFRFKTRLVPLAETFCNCLVMRKSRGPYTSRVVTCFCLPMLEPSSVRMHHKEQIDVFASATVSFDLAKPTKYRQRTTHPLI